MNDAVIIIPSRLGSTRLTEKSLADIEGKPMVVRVAEQAARVRGVAQVLVATDAEKIRSAVEAAGFGVVMTPSELKSGTDRVAYVAQKLSHRYVINLQGDEPLVNPLTIEAALATVLKGEKMGSVMAPFRTLAEYNSSSIVKCITDKNQHAIYFSRHPLPYAVKQYSEAELQQDCAAGHLGRHIGIYAFQREFLLEFSKLKPVFLEERESLEQLRALFYGVKIGMGQVEQASPGVDTAEDLELVRRLYREGKNHG